MFTWLMNARDSMIGRRAQWFKTAKGSEDLPEEVSARERDDIRARREDKCIAHNKLTGPVSPDRGLVGLCLSGGGIRSASFNLGILQVLSELKLKDGKAEFIRFDKDGRCQCGEPTLLDRMDYLSTVSGGGYVGSCLSANATKSEDGLNALRHVRGVPESKAFRYLRNHANYLINGGFMALMRIPALMLRGVVTNFIMLLPYLLLAALMLVYFMGEDFAAVFVDSLSSASDRDNYLEGYRDQISEILLSRANRYTFMATAVLFGLYMLYPVAQFLFGEHASWKTRDWVTKYIVAGPLVLWGVFCFTLYQPWFVYNLDRLVDLQDNENLHYYLVSVGPVVLGALAAATSADEKESLKSILIQKAAAIGLVVLTPLIAWLLFLIIARFLMGGDEGFGSFKENTTTPVYLMHQLGLFVLLGIAPVIDFLRECSYLAWALEPSVWTTVKDQGRFEFATGLVLLLLVLTRFFYDVNWTGLLPFYRDRLSKAFLFSQNRGRVEPLDELKMSELSAEKGPYHLVNATINLPRSQRSSRRGRNSASFTFSRNFVGSQQTGYCDTKGMERVHPNMTLGTAMAISAAAVSSRMGRLTVGGVAPLLTVLNMRLGYWLPNPKEINGVWLSNVSGWSWLHRKYKQFGNVGPRAFFLEMFGDFDETGKVINVSDGGHFENLGLYELVRRKCKVILCCDAGADPNYTFLDLGEAIRLIRIDLATKISMEGRMEIAPNPEDAANNPGNSNAHLAWGTIHYGVGESESEEETGILLYLKTSMTGDESTDVHAYKKDFDPFPHESTGDQFFDERQFEVYRALGHHVASCALLGDKKNGSRQPVHDGVKRWLDTLRDAQGE